MEDKIITIIVAIFTLGIVVIITDLEFVIGTFAIGAGTIAAVAICELIVGNSSKGKKE